MRQRKDPTNTLELRGRAMNEINLRFRRLQRKIAQKLNNKGVLVGNEERRDGFVYVWAAGLLEEFQAWLHDQIEQEILSTSAAGVAGLISGQPAASVVAGSAAAKHWLNVYVGTSYSKGARRANEAISKMLPDGQELPNASVLTNPYHVRRAKLIFTRVFSQLKGITETMEGQIAKVMSEGIIQGQNPYDVARNINDRVEKIGRTRSRLLARTEMINANNQAVIQETIIDEGIVGGEIMMLWLTRLDGLERPSHRLRHKKVYTKEKVQPLLGEPNCRCAVTPWHPEFAGLVDDL